MLKTIERRTVEKLPFWKTVNSHVLENGSSPAISLFKNPSRSTYYLIKVVFDRSTQYWAILCSQNAVLHWEKMIVKLLSQMR